MSGRDLIARLAAALRVQLDGVGLYSELLAEADARALLAEAQPEAVEPTDEELKLLLAEYRHLSAVQFARAVLARWGRPAPEPVSVAERPWEREGWCDAEGRCWLFGKVEGDWRLMSATNSGLPSIKYCFSHALPHWTLPVPQEQVDG
jgi:hypothetical protein